MTQSTQTPGFFAFPRSIPKRIALFLLSVAFVVAGVNHFINPMVYVKIMPSMIPYHLELVYLSGVFEILGGLGVLPRSTRRFAGWGLILLLIAVFPANVNMALKPEQFSDIPLWGLYLRLPLQLVLMLWTWWVTLSERPLQEKSAVSRHA